MPVTVLLVAKKVPGIDFPIDHDTYPEDCENVACTKIEGRYRPGSWILVTQRWDDSEHDFMEVENYACVECAERAKKSFNSERIIRRREVPPTAMMRRGIKYPEEKTVVAVSKPLTWEMKPKKTFEEKVQETLKLADEVLGMTMADIPITVKKEKKPIQTRPVTPKPVEEQEVQTILGPMMIPRPSSPRTKNERNAVNPIPFIERKPKKQLKELKRKEKMTEEVIRQTPRGAAVMKKIDQKQRQEQAEAYRELCKARCEEYLRMKNFCEILNSVSNETLRIFVINTFIKHMNFDTINAKMALKHHGKLLSHKEMNKLMHVLNGNTTAAALAAAVLAGFTYLARRQRIAVINPHIVGGHITGGTVHMAAPTVEELAEEATDANIAATALGNNLHTIINDLRARNQQFQEELAEREEEFQRILLQERRTLERADRERERQRPKQPELKIDPPEYYEGEPSEIDAWLRRMAYYFNQVRLNDPEAQIAYTIQRIRKGKNNRAGNWANSKIHEMARYSDEKINFVNAYPGRPFDFALTKASQPAVPEVLPAADGTGGHPEWPAYEFTNKPPFLDMPELMDEARQYFLTTETREEAVKKLRSLRQTSTIEEYIIEFKGWLHLSGFDEIAAVDQFKRGIKTALGRKVIETGNPGDGSTPGQLQAWYTRATELERSYRESEQYYGKREFQIKTKKPFFKQNNAQAGPSKTATTITVKADDAMDVDKTKTTRPLPTCYSCGKVGHIARNCKGKEKVRSIMTKEDFEKMTDEEKNELRTVLGFQTNQ